MEYPKTRALFHKLAECAGDRVAVPGEEFPGWEFWVPVAIPRSSSVFRILRDPVLVLDEPEAITGAADRVWKRLQESVRQGSCPPEKAYLTGEELREEMLRNRSVAFRELEILTGVADGGGGVQTRPSIAFHGNIQLAVAEGRNVVERGGKVVYFAPSTGELERIADILQEYRVLSSLESIPPCNHALSRGADVPGRRVCGHLSRQGSGSARDCIHRSSDRSIRAEDLFDVSEIAAPADLNRGRLQPFRPTLQTSSRAILSFIRSMASASLSVSAQSIRVSRPAISCCLSMQTMPSCTFR